MERDEIQILIFQIHVLQVTFKPQLDLWSLIYTTTSQVSRHKNVQVTNATTEYKLLILRFIKQAFFS